jgi:hypothetical protein
MSNFFYSCCAMPETSRHTTVAVMTVYMYTRILHAFCLRLVSPSLPPFLPPSSLSLSLSPLSLSLSIPFFQTDRQTIFPILLPIPYCIFGTYCTFVYLQGFSLLRLGRTNARVWKWALLEFEDGKTVNLKNSVSTSFYIGRARTTAEYYYQFDREDNNAWRSISEAHCHIQRLEKGSFSSRIKG